MKILPVDPVHMKLAADWKYVPSNKTDISKTFRRERARLAILEKLTPSKIREFKKNEGMQRTKLR